MRTICGHYFFKGKTTKHQINKEQGHCVTYITYE